MIAVISIARHSTVRVAVARLRRRPAMAVPMIAMVAIARHPTVRVAVPPMAVSMLLRHHLPLELLRLRVTPVVLLQHRIVVLTRCQVG